MRFVDIDAGSDDEDWPDDEFEDLDVSQESRDFAILSMWEDGTLQRLAESRSEPERRVAESLIARAEKLRHAQGY